MINADYLSEKLESLMVELDSLCRENEIEYYLMEEALVAAIRGIQFPQKRKDFSIAIHGKDIRKFSQLVERIPERNLESLLDHADFPGFYMRYNDVNTLFFDTERRKQQYENCCIGVNIYVLCPYQEKTDFVGKKLEKLKEKWAESMAANVSGCKFWCSSMFSKIVKFDKRFSVMMKKKADTEDLVEFYTADGKHFIFEQSKFGKGQDAVVGKHIYRVPRAKNVVGKATNGGNLMFSTQNAIRVLGMRYIVNYHVPGKKFAEEVRSKRLNRRRDIKKVRKYFAWKEKVFNPIWSKRKKYLEYYDLTKERFSFYEELCGEKRETILALYAQKEYKKLAEILGPYISRIRLHNQKGFGLYFDRDMYVIAISTMAYLDLKKEKIKSVAKKNINRYKRILEKVPQPYLRPLHVAQNETYTGEDLERIREEIRAEIEVSLNEMLEKF